jgi:hypothetical protein
MSTSPGVDVRGSVSGEEGGTPTMASKPTKEHHRTPYVTRYVVVAVRHFAVHNSPTSATARAARRGPPGAMTIMPSKYRPACPVSLLNGEFSL